MDKVRCNECHETIKIIDKDYIIKEMRCKKCNKLLGKGIGQFEIICPRCGELNKN